MNIGFDVEDIFEDAIFEDLAELKVVYREWRDKQGIPTTNVDLSDEHILLVALQTAIQFYSK